MFDDVRCGINVIVFICVSELLMFVIVVLDGWVFGGGVEFVYVVDIWIGMLVLRIGNLEMGFGILVVVGVIWCLFEIVG